jgi:MFS family permease
MELARPTRVRYLVLVWFCALAALAYIHRNCLSVPTKDIARDLHVDEDDVQFILGMFFWGYAFLQVPGGWLGGRWGSRLVVPLVLLIGSAATALMSLGLGFEFMLVCRFVVGMSQAALFPCAVQAFARWFPLSERAAPSGWLAAFMSVGGALALALSGWLLSFMTWQALVWLYSIPGFVCAAWFYLWFRDDPAEHRGVGPEELALLPRAEALIGSKVRQDSAAADDGGVFGAGKSTSKLAACSTWQQIFLTPSVLLVCTQQFCRAAAYFFFATSWPTFLQDARGFDVSESGYVGALPLLGVVLGSAVGGQVMDWVYRRTRSLSWSRRGVAIVNLLASAWFALLGFLLADVWLTVTCLTISCFFAGACGPAAYTATIDLGGRHVATLFSVMNMAGNIGAALMPAAVVFIKNRRGWDEVLLLLAALYVAGAACWLFVRLPRTA